MANVYTRTGDKGTTGLFGGNRVSKDDIRVECYGTVDEANSMIGYASVLVEDEEVRMHLKKIQNRLFVVGAELASDESGLKKLKDKISENDVFELIMVLGNVVHLSGGCVIIFTIKGSDLNKSISFIIFQKIC